VQVDVLDDTDVLVRPGVTSGAVEDGCRSVEHQQQGSEVRGQPDRRQPILCQGPATRDDEERETHVEDQGKRGRQSVLAEVTDVGIAEPQGPKDEGDREQNIPWVEDSMRVLRRLDRGVLSGRSGQQQILRQECLAVEQHFSCRDRGVRSRSPPLR